MDALFVATEHELEIRIEDHIGLFEMMHLMDIHGILVEVVLGKDATWCEGTSKVVKAFGVGTTTTTDGGDTIHGGTGTR